MHPAIKNLIKFVVLLVVIGGIGWYYWNQWNHQQQDNGFIGSNGRIEAVEIDIATKAAGRVEQILVNEGDFIQQGQTLAIMQSDTLQARLAEAEAQLKQAQNAVKSAEAAVAVHKSDVSAARAGVAQREAEYVAAKKRFTRTEVLSKERALSIQDLDDTRARVRSAEAAVTAAKSQVSAAQAAVLAAEAQVTGAKSQVTAVEATIRRIRSDIQDTRLTSPRDGRVQYRIVQPGEIIGAGGKVLNLVDLSDVYMTFFVPEAVAGRLALGQEVRIVLDAAPQYVIPANVSFVDSTAQFTPKTVETASERQKLMFRVKARLPKTLLQAHLKRVKTGLPGMAWLKTDKDKNWPDHLQIHVPE
ncbi:HlyD family efflux transporter periplasmic adaptor subunit [Thiomicrorhabdus sp.]|uniref:HlyD family secretion protein n=1 Tax=Thiomicrorhabdus sp. TaxID=2039724 RepID=UPI0029C6FCC3|nr:HlyD family efflux transporter periplasmic adaptor subunit [Thiomicrorhabdus sp.]